MTRFKQAFRNALVRQAAIQGRELNPFYQQIGEAVFRSCELAMSPEKAGRWTVVSAETGAGKTNSAVTAAVALIETDPTASVTFLVETMRRADSLFKDIRALLPCPAACTSGCDTSGCMKRHVMVYTTAHSRGNARLAQDDLAKRAELDGWGFIPEVFFDDRQIDATRIAVGTHKMWLDAKWRGKALLRWQEKPRTLVFVDEAPQLVTLIERTPVQVAELREAIFQFDLKQPPTDPAREDRQRLLQLLNRIEAIMRRDFEAHGSTYVNAELLNPEEGQTFAGLHMRNLRAWAKAAGAASGPQIDGKATGFEETVQFLEAASRGYVFLSRQSPRSFLAYRMRADPPPGAVILDATADIAGYVALAKGMDLAAVPRVSYRRMRTTWIEIPKDFRNAKKIKDIGSDLAEPYAEWIKAVMAEHTEPGDRVFLVTHKDMLKWRHLLPRSPMPGQPVEWLPDGCSKGDERLVWTMHFGNGVGENAFKACNKAFIFGDFWMPQKVIIGQVLGYTGRKAAADTLPAGGKWRGQGAFLTAQQGHALRWQKQLATRIATREIDGDGICGAAELFLANDGQLLDQHNRLYPGAPPVTKVWSLKEKKFGQAGLVELLDTFQEAVLWSDQVEKETGIPARNLGRVVKTARVAQAMKANRWTFEAGSRGRGSKSCFRRMDVKHFGFEVAA